jgi:hypothetical protein
VARRAHIAVVARAEDEVTGALTAASRAMADAAKAVTESDGKMARSSDAVARAMRARLPVGKQVELALARERAQGDATATQLVDLRERHARLTAEMARLARRGQDVPEALLAEARAAEVATEALKERQRATDSGGKRVGLAAGLQVAAGAATAVVGAAAAAGAGLFALASRASATGDAVFVLGDKLGVGAESLTRLTFAARQNGATQQDLAVALQALSNRAVRAPQEFAKIGVSVRDASGQIKAVDVLFRDVAEAISRLPPGAARVAASQALMEESGRKLVPVLQLGARGLDALGARADALGVVLSQDSAVAANAFGNEMTAVSDALGATAYQVGSLFVPAFTEAFKAVQGGAGDLNAGIAENFAGLRREITLAAADAVEAGATIARVGSTVLDGLRLVSRGFDLGRRAISQFSEATDVALSLATFGLYNAARSSAALASALGNTEPETDSTAQSFERLAASLRASADAQATMRRQWWEPQEVAKQAADWSLLALGVEQYTPAVAAAGVATTRATRNTATAAKTARKEVVALQDAHVQAFEAAHDLSEFEAADAAQRAVNARAVAEGERMLAAERADRERVQAEARKAAEAERMASAQRLAQQEAAVASSIQSGLLGAYEAAKRGPKAFADFALAELERIAVSSVLRVIARSLASAFTGGVGGGLLSILGFADGGFVPQRFAAGGRVRGGTPGKDSVPALLMPGELVVPTDVASTLPQSFVDALLGRRTLPRLAAGGVVGGASVAPAAPAPVYVALNVQTAAPPTSAAVERLVRDSLPRALASLNSAGYRVPGTQRVRR